jgi:hypothetical protein
MDGDHNCDSYIHIPSSQTYRSCVPILEIIYFTRISAISEHLINPFHCCPLRILPMLMTVATFSLLFAFFQSSHFQNFLSYLAVSCVALSVCRTEWHRVTRGAMGSEFKKKRLNLIDGASGHVLERSELNQEHS